MLFLFWEVICVMIRTLTLCRLAEMLRRPSVRPGS